MHRLDADKTHWEKARLELHKNTTCYFERILEAALHKTATVPPISQTIQVRRTGHRGQYRRSKGELISNGLLWFSTRELANVDWPVRTYIHQLCADAKRCLENLPGAINDREGWRESEVTPSDQHDLKIMIMIIYIYICVCVCVCVCVHTVMDLTNPIPEI